MPDKNDQRKILPHEARPRRERSPIPDPRARIAGSGFSRISVAGQDTVEAPDEESGVTLVEGAGMTLTTTEDSVEFECTQAPGPTRFDELDDVDLDTIAPTIGDGIVWDGTDWIPDPPDVVVPPPVVVDDLDDVDTTTSAPSNGDTLEWDGTHWVPGTPTAAVDLDGLTDVVLTSATDGQVLTKNGADWVNQDAPTPSLATADLTDVSSASPGNGWRLVYSTALSEWVPTPPRADLNLSQTVDGDSVRIDTDGSGTNTDILTATATDAGVMAAVDRVKLDALRFPQVFYMRKGAAQSTTTTYAAITGWVTPPRADDVYLYDITTGEVEFDDDWEGLINLHLYADGTANDRCFLEAGLQEDTGSGWSDIAGSRMAAYSSRTTALDKGGVSLSGFWRSFSSGDKVRWVVRHSQSSADVTGHWSMLETPQT
jgi:hypothetical protein